MFYPQFKIMGSFQITFSNSSYVTEKEVFNIKQMLFFLHLWHMNTFCTLGKHVE